MNALHKYFKAKTSCRVSIVMFDVTWASLNWFKSRKCEKVRRFTFCFKSFTILISSWLFYETARVALSFVLLCFCFDSFNYEPAKCKINKQIKTSSSTIHVRIFAFRSSPINFSLAHFWKRCRKGNFINFMDVQMRIMMIRFLNWVIREHVVQYWFGPGLTKFL